MERDSPELRGIVIATSTDLQELISLLHLSTMVQTGTKVKMFQHCLLPLKHSLFMARFNKYLYSCLIACTVSLQHYYTLSSIGLALDVCLAIKRLFLANFIIRLAA